MNLKNISFKRCQILESESLNYHNLVSDLQVKGHA